MSAESPAASLDAAPAPQPPARRGRTPGWWIPWIYVGLILLVACVNGFMIYMAVSTNSGLETDDAYRKGIKYNQMIQGAREQEKRGWRIGFDFSSTEKGKGRVALSLHDRDGNLLHDAKVDIKALRPVVQGHDMPVEVSYLGEGRYGANIDFPLSGVWDLKLSVDHPSGDYQETKRIWVQ